MTSYGPLTAIVVAGKKIKVSAAIVFIDELSRRASSADMNEFRVTCAKRLT